jgi:hypothetical protein
MHVKSTSQVEFPMSLETHRNKPHSKLLLDVPRATSPVTLGRRADGPPPTVGQSASHGPNIELLKKNTLLEFCRADRSSHTTDGLQFTSNFHTELDCLWNSPRPCTVDGPLVHTGRSAIL